MPIIIPFSIFGFIVFSAFGCYWFFFRQPSAASERLEQLRNDHSGVEPEVTETIT